jgi:hypothetical protein
VRRALKVAVGGAGQRKARRESEPVYSEYPPSQRKAGSGMSVLSSLDGLLPTNNRIHLILTWNSQRSMIALKGEYLSPSNGLGSWSCGDSCRIATGVPIAAF